MYNDLIISDAKNNLTMAATCEMHSETSLEGGQWPQLQGMQSGYWNADYSGTFLCDTKIMVATFKHDTEHTVDEAPTVSKSGVHYRGGRGCQGD